MGTCSSSSFLSEKERGRRDYTLLPLVQLYDSFLSLASRVRFETQLDQMAHEISGFRFQVFQEIDRVQLCSGREVRAVVASNDRVDDVRPSFFDVAPIMFSQSIVAAQAKLGRKCLDDLAQLFTFPSREPKLNHGVRVSQTYRLDTLQRQ